MPVARFHWRTFLKSRRERLQAEQEPPLRGEILGVSQLQRHARMLAKRHEVRTGSGGRSLLERLVENEEVLRQYHAATPLAEQRRRIVPAAEWLLDNFYLIEEQIKTARRHFPRHYSRELPFLAKGASAGFPRVYDIALELIAHVDGRIEAEYLGAFVSAYQTVARLNLGELWAVPIMLRLALLENLRRIANLLSEARRERDVADAWADRLVEVSQTDPSQLIVVVAEMAKANLELSRPFVAEFWRRLQTKAPSIQLALHWVEEQLGAQGFTVEQLVQAESQHQASTQVSVATSIASLRFLDATDWRDFVESMSVVEHVLRTDPAGIHARTDFTTRDACRHVVERMARTSERSEEDVARLAVALASECRKAGGEEREIHVGFYLIGRGRPQLEQRLELTWTPGVALKRLGRRFPLSLYLGSIGVLTALTGWWVVAAVDWTGRSWWAAALFFLLPIMCGSHLAVAVVNWFATTFIPPRLLPRLDFSDGIEPSCGYHGGDSNDDRERAGDRVAGRGSGGALPGESRRSSVLRAADGLS